MWALRHVPHDLWSVTAGEAGFLPRFVLPFVQLCGAKSESAFEMVATLLLIWCKGWWELFPNPPLPLLRRFLVSGFTSLSALLPTL